MNRKLKIHTFLFCIGIGLFIYTQMVFAADQEIKVLIYSGANNHDWKATTPEMERIFKNDPNFQVEITNHPESITVKDLENIDVIVSNWNNYGKPELTWSDSKKQAFLDFVQNGGGHITIHAGGSSFYDWPDYHKIAACWGKDTDHGPCHEFTVQPGKTLHPITLGIEPFTIKDELWHNTVFPPGSKTLMTAYSAKDKGGSGKDEPVLAVNSFGLGRCVNLMLGHDANAIQNPGFKTLLKRSVEWTGTERSIDDTLKQEHKQFITDKSF